ncbi:MAG: ABC transporter substrate-binding protein [Xanthomonadales bacterium]|nr:ABC transporter substrate-binding protein [Xanthomonadales bacterium]
MVRRFAAVFAAGLFAAVAVAGTTAGPARAQDKSLTLCWASWDPANALRQLSKDFTEQTGIEMNYEFVPWTNFADRFLTVLNSRGDLCDLMIGDSQWLGIGAEFGHYVKLNDFFEQEGISMDKFLDAAVYNYATWPKGTDNYWALPAMGDAVGYVYRQDWFQRPEIRKAFKKEYGYELGVPETWQQLLDDRQILPGSRDRRQEALRHRAVHRARLRGDHDGRHQRPLRLGCPVRRPKQALPHEGLRQLGQSRRGDQVLQEALRVLHATRALKRLHDSQPGCL